jgi:hypothetical protein
MKPTTDIIELNSIVYPEVESKISATEAELNAFAVAQAIEDAQSNEELTETRDHIIVLQPVFNQVQLGIYDTNAKVLPTANILSVKEIETKTNKEIDVISKQIKDQLLEKGKLVHRRNELPVNHKKRAWAKFLMPVAISAALCDLVLTYSNARGFFPWYFALILACAVGCLIAFGHIPISSWIHKSTKDHKKLLKAGLVLILAGLFFWVLGNMRAQAVNSAVNIGIDSSTVTTGSTYHIYGWAIALISFALFTVVLLFSVYTWTTKKEHEIERQYDILTNSIKNCDAEIEKLNRKKIEISTTAQKQKHEARRIFNYASSCIRRLKMIGDAAILKYRQTYIRYSSKQVPHFFDKPISNKYDEGFNFFSTDNN